MALSRVGGTIMRLKDFMNEKVETVTAEDSVEIAYQRMRLNEIRHLVVLDGKTVVGVLSQRDVNKIQGAEREGVQVRDMMESSVVTAEPDTTLREAANLMRGRSIGCLPIVDRSRHNALVGIITTTDILELVGQGIERIMPNTPKRPVSRENTGRKPPSFNPRLGKT